VVVVDSIKIYSQIPDYQQRRMALSPPEVQISKDFSFELARTVHPPQPASQN